MSNIKYVFTLFLACSLAVAHAQYPTKEASPKIAVYVSGSNAGINKTFGNKLLAAMVQSGKYVEITDPGSFHDGLANSQNVGASQILQAAKQHGADFVCAVSLAEASGIYSFSANLIKIADSQVIKTSSLNRAIRTLDDLTAATNEFARQLLPPPVLPPPVLPPLVPPPLVSPPPMIPAPPDTLVSQKDTVPPPPLPPVAAPAVAQKQCAKTYNINELIFKVKDGFPTQLKDCSSKLAKEMALAAMPFGKKSAPVEPKGFMKQCAVDGIKKEIPDGFPGADQFVGIVDKFVQNIMNAALAGSSLDPKKLISAVGSIDINGLLNDVKKLASGECVVDSPYTPPAAQANKASDSKESNSEDEKDKSTVSFGIRAGFNLSHLYAEYDGCYHNSYSSSSCGKHTGTYEDIFGIQLGFVLDIAASSWFHIQPGLMYMQKGMANNGTSLTSHYVEVPALMSFKLSVLRLNAGPYLGILASSGDGSIFSTDFGFSYGFGFDIGMFYIGMLYDYGLVNMSNMDNFSFYNRTLGFNIGVNL